MQSKSKVPFRHMAIESIEYRKFTIYSDIWSYGTAHWLHCSVCDMRAGVTAWEIYSYGLLPYDEINPRELPEMLRRHVVRDDITCVLTAVQR